MIIRRIAEGIRNQDWFVVMVEVMIVVVGIFIGLQVDDWNQASKDKKEVSIYLERLQLDLEQDKKFFSFLLIQAKDKQYALTALKEVLWKEDPIIKNPDKFFTILAQSIPFGWEFPEVQTVTFYDFQNSGKLLLIDDADLRRKISFYYQESLHSSDRVQSRITGYSSAMYEIIDVQAGVALRGYEANRELIKFKGEFDPKPVISRFLKFAPEEGFLRLLTAEENYTQFLTAMIKAQLTSTEALTKAISEALERTSQ